MKTLTFSIIGLGALALTSAAWMQDTTEAGFEPTAAMMRYMMPGETHRALDALAGDWDLELKWRMSADAAWESSPAKSNRVWILGDRFLEEVVESEWMGEAFEGRGLLGFDTLSEEYTSIWYDNMGTGVMVGTGPSTDGTTIGVEGTLTDAMRDKTHAWFRSEITVKSADEHTWESFAKDDAGVEYKSMQITYTRS